MKARTGLREMPPWFVEKNIGIQQFKDDISLSDDEIAAFAAWADAGAPRGNPADMPPPITWADATRVDHRHPGPDRLDARDHDAGRRGRPARRVRAGADAADRGPLYQGRGGEGGPAAGRRHEGPVERPGAQRQRLRPVHDSPSGDPYGGPVLRIGGGARAVPADARDRPERDHLSRWRGRHPARRLGAPVHDAPVRRRRAGPRARGRRLHVPSQGVQAEIPELGVRQRGRGYDRYPGWRRQRAARRVLHHAQAWDSQHLRAAHALERTADVCGGDLSRGGRRADAESARNPQLRQIRPQLGEGLRVPG